MVRIRSVGILVRAVADKALWCEKLQEFLVKKSVFFQPADLLYLIADLLKVLFQRKWIDDDAGRLAGGSLPCL